MDLDFDRDEVFDLGSALTFSAFDLLFDCSRDNDCRRERTRVSPDLRRGGGSPFESNSRDCEINCPLLSK